MLALDVLSHLVLADQDLARAARLWGAAGNWTAATGAGLATFTSEWVEEHFRPTVRMTLPPEDLARWAREGAAMALDEVVAYALEALVTEPGSHVDEATTTS